MLQLTLFLLSSLQRGDDPYQILGLSHGATAQEIKKAFRTITFEHHPDRHRDAKSYQIWMRANDAYELLSNPARKMRYDQTGVILDIDEEGDANDVPQKKERRMCPLITQQMFHQLMQDKSEWIMLIYQTFDCNTCKKQMEIWEDVAHIIVDYVKVGKIDALQAPDLMEELGLSKVPVIASVQKVDSGYKVIQLSTGFRSVDDGLAKIFRHWNANVEFLKHEKDLKAWRKRGKDFVHVLQTGNGSPTADFLYSAASMSDMCMFAFLRNTSLANNTVLVFRDQNLHPIQIKAQGMRLLTEIENYACPLFPEITWDNVRRICEQWCVVFVGKEPESIMNFSATWPFNTGKLSPMSSLTNRLGVTIGNWIVISNLKVWSVDNLLTPNDFTLLCSRLYNGETPESVSKKFITALKPEEFFWSDVRRRIYPFLTYVPYLSFALIIPIVLHRKKEQSETDEITDDVSKNIEKERKENEEEAVTEVEHEK